MALILDGTSPTGAWSMFRDLLTSFVGGTRYTTATGVNSLNDQTGNSRHFSQGTGANQPTATTAGPLSRACANFDGIDDRLNNGSVLTNFFSASTGYIVVSFIADTVTLNASASYGNNPVIGTTGDYMGIFLKNTGTPASILSYNWDGTDDAATISAAITTGTIFVAEWRHESGNLYVRLNGGTEASTASGNTTTMPGVWLIGATDSLNGDIKFFEMATYSTVPALATRNAIVADFMAQHVAAPAGRAKVWNGSSWTVKPVKVWSGSAWVTKPVKVWNGSAWV